MTTLVQDDFTEDEKFAINRRLDLHDRFLLLLQRDIASEAERFNRVIDFDAASRKVQDAAIAQLIAILHQILDDRDNAGPTSTFAPHSIRFNPRDTTPNAIPEPSFPVLAPELFAADDLPTYLAALPLYDIPVIEASVDQGETAPTSPVEEGWQIWREQSPGPGREKDPVPATALELTAAFPILKTEFDERQDERLNLRFGSYVQRNQIETANATSLLLVDILNQRKDFWETLGFTGV
jgi:hypothetical protein